ncbi:MFS transporter [Ferrimonas balearica]|uniref:MFS transporter n=1 Tax=Ferrimonas balearica TaxID=44012 RepID=UPI001C99D62E|nr:MFS transporter [Ferrimonas balearica]MBY5993609.1 MFS transporter [Ferrimonas balearica]
MIEPGTPDYRRASRALALGSLLVFANLYLFQPLLPALATQFAVPSTQANWVHAATTLGLALTLVPWALMSERWGRRATLLLSLALLPVLGVAQALVSDLVQLALLRGLMGVVLAGFVAVAVAYMAEEFSPVALALAVGAYVAANSLGGILGRVYGGMVGDWLGWKSATLGLALATAVGTALVWRWLPAPRRFTPSPAPFGRRCQDALAHLKSPLLWWAMLLGGLNFALFVNQFSVMGFRLVAPPHQLPVALVSLIFLCYLTGTLTSRLSGRWSLRFGPRSGMTVGTLVALAGALLARVEAVWAMVLGLLLISAGAFLVHALAYAWVSQHARGAKASATALYLVHYYLGGSLGGFWLLYGWEQAGWDGVILGSGLLYGGMLLAVARLGRQPQGALLAD